MSNTPNHAGRAHALLSASSSARWLACPASAVIAVGYPNKDTAFTREGTLAHEVAEWVVSPPVLPCIEDVRMWINSEHITQEMYDCAQGYRDYVQELLKTDDAIILLERRVDFSPWVSGGFGTADCIIIQGTHMDVIDYKYGQGVKVSAVENPQMMLYGLGALNDYGFIYDIQTVGLHVYQPRMNNVSKYETGTAELTHWGEYVVKPTAEQAAKGEGGFAAGEHCRFCPHAGKCPTLAESCTKVFETSGGQVAVPTLAPWQIRDILVAEPRITNWLKAVRDRALESLLNGEEIPGFKVVAGRSSRSWADDKEVAALLDAAGYAREAYTSMAVLSPYNMEKALGKKKCSELLSGQMLTIPGSPTVAPESDKRPPYDRQAAAYDDFK